MAGRPKIFNEEEVLGKAINIFWNNGYEATSTESLVTGMELNRGSLYHTFGSKKELFAKSIDLFANNSTKAIEQLIHDSVNPVEGIKKFFMSLASSSMEEHNKGCFMCNTIAELNNIDQELTSKASGNLKKLENVFLKYIEVAKNNKQLTTKEDSKVLARYLLNLWNGINITRRIYKDKNELEPLIKLQLAVLY
ncbi:TetR/AcrR family transcriptional regulator [Flavobacterium sp. UBA7682]|uniref:TetR/AcrR family transcriptional regulator n=1 Tax=Flavobacterium sp. UBA7682 TaxID=1946560 RepID=UPI0025BB5E95|nr:TetR family transcriptional regulator C-terminal domain-containing protein [Flavobacterium sp. UBA7682]